MVPSSHKTFFLCYRNVIHGSDSIESANKEIALWFPEGLADWQSSQHPWIYEK
jgi:nucleoside-diphosphate kinase